ncbi:MAG: diphthine synthase [Candidatus Micrarchaeia archaeon]
MLYLVGTGLAEGDISQRALEVCKRSKLFVEHHTSFISKEYLSWIESLAGKQAIALERSDLEEKARKLVEQASNEDVALLCGGDPLVATTHKILFIEAKRLGVAVGILHSSSVLSAAIGESGLDFYRFGQICTIPTWSEHYKPVSFYETISRNRKSKLHSLVLFDFSSSSGNSMPLSQAINVLEEAEKHYKEGIATQDTKIIILHNLSQKGERKVYCTINEAKSLQLGSGRTSMVIPTELSDIESEIIKSIY